MCRILRRVTAFYIYVRIKSYIYIVCRAASPNYSGQIYLAGKCISGAHSRSLANFDKFQSERHSNVTTVNIYIQIMQYNYRYTVIHIYIYAYIYICAFMREREREREREG